MTQERLSRILNFAAIGLVVIALILAAIFIFRSIATPTWHQSRPVGYNVYAPDVVDDTTIRYYTGNTFATLNTTTGERKPLTSHYLLPNITNVHWLKEGVVFLSQTADDFTDLGQKTAEMQGSASETPIEEIQPTYWYLSFKDNNLVSLKTAAYDLPETTILTTSDGGFLFKTDDTHFALLKSDGTITYDTFTVTGDIRPVYATDSELYYVETDLQTNETHVRKIAAGNDQKSTVVYEKLYALNEGTITSSIVSRDGKTFFYEFNTGELTRSVRELDVTNKKVSTLIGDFQGTLHVDPRAVSIVTLRNDWTDLTIIPRTGDRQHVQIKATANLLSLQPLAAPFGNSILYTTSDGRATIVREKNTEQQYVARNEAFEKKITSANGYSLVRNITDTSDMSYSLTVAEGYYVPVVESFKSAMARDGMSPYEIKLTLSPGMRATTGPTSPSAAPSSSH